MRRLQSTQSTPLTPTPSIARPQASLSFGVLKPIVSATAAALLSMGAGQAHAVCATMVSTPQITAYDITDSCPLEVTSGGAIDVIGSTAVNVNTSNEFSSSISNAGRISGATGIYVQDTSHIYWTAISNTGTIAGTSYAVNRAAPAQNDSITNYAGGQIVGGIVATYLDNLGTITLKSDVALNDIANTGNAATAILSGGYFGESGSMLRIAIVDTSNEMSYSYLQATSAFVAGTLDVDVKANSGLTAGQAFHVVRAPSISGSFEQITDNSALFNFTQRLVSASTPDGGIYIDSVRALTILQATIDSGNKPGQGAATVLDTGTQGLSGVISALGLLSTEQEVSDAVSQTLPLLTGGMGQAMDNVLHSTNLIIQARQEGQHGRSTGDEFLGDKHAWFKPFGSWANQDDRKGVSGYDADTYGMVFGADAEVSDTNRLGVAFSYAHSNIDSNSKVAPQSADVASYQLAVYGSHDLSDTTDISFQADIGKHNNEGKRHIALMSTTAKSDYSSWSGHVGVGLAHTYHLSDKTSLTPSVRADYTRVRDESYTEKNAGALNLHVKSNTTEELILGLGGKLTHAYSDKATLTANLSVGYDVINEQASITSAFAGAPTASFVTKGLDPSPWLVRGGLGVVGKVTETVEISARYDVEARKDFDNQTASVKVRWAF